MADALEIWKLRAETESEWVGPLTLTDISGDLITDYTVALVAMGAVASNWVAPTDLGGELGIRVGSLTPWPILRGRRYIIVSRYAASSTQIPLTDMGVIIAR